MSIFRKKKPAEFAARHWDGTPARAMAIVDWIGEHGGTAGYYGDPPALKITTARGWVVAMPGDWIVERVEGEFRPVRPDVFAALYKAV